MFYSKKARVILSIAMIVSVLASYVLMAYFDECAWEKWTRIVVCLLGMCVAGTDMLLRSGRRENTILPCVILGALSVPVARVIVNWLELSASWGLIFAVVISLTVLGMVFCLAFLKSGRQ